MSGSNGSRHAAWLSAAVLTVSLAAGAAHASASPTGSPARVDGEVYAALAGDGTAEFLVYLDETADLSGAATLASKPARTAHVYQRLTAVARDSQADLRASLDSRGVPYESFWIANVLLVEGDRALVDELAARADVARIEPDRSYPLIQPTAGFVADPGINAIEWGVSNIGADQVWSQFGATGEGIVVANIDTGVQFDHPALVNQYRGTATGSHDYNWFDPSAVCLLGSPCDNAGHGTHTMGTMVGDDGAGNQIGVAPGAQWIAAKGCESNACSGSSLLAAGEWMVAPTDSNGQNPDPTMAPDIVNNSWGGGHGDTWYQAVVDAWVSAGIYPMFAAGNAGPDCASVSSPGDNLSAYAVAAHDINNAIASFSSRGPSGVGVEVVKPNLSAPGVGVRSAIPTDGFGLASGTSMATPHASGAVALLWSAVPALQGDIEATRAVLDLTAVDTSTNQCGGTATNNFVYGEGRLDVLAAVTQATAATP
jgi:subtilisin family serine protease